MNTGKKSNIGETLFKRLLEAFNQGAAEVVALYTEDATVEYPYAASLGSTAKLNMREYFNHLKGGLEQMPAIKFSGVRVNQTTALNSYWAEVHGETVIPKTGKLYQQDYVMYFEVTDDKFSFYREYWNAVPVMNAFGGGESFKETFNTNEK
jgi:uncharacterized protein